MSVETIRKVAQFQSSKHPETSDCKCEAQIADILARLEGLEREALTGAKMAEASRGPSMFEVMWQRNGA